VDEFTRIRCRLPLSGVFSVCYLKIVNNETCIHWKSIVFLMNWIFIYKSNCNAAVAADGEGEALHECVHVAVYRSPRSRWVYWIYWSDWCHRVIWKHRIARFYRQHRKTRRTWSVMSAFSIVLCVRIERSCVQHLIAFTLIWRWSLHGDNANVASTSLMPYGAVWLMPWLQLRFDCDTTTHSVFV